MRKVIVDIKLRLTLLADDSVELPDVVHEFEYAVNEDNTQVDVLDTEIIGVEIIDSK